MSTTYETRRSEVQAYFDRTAFEAWARLTSDAPVSRIRATVRAGRERMRATLLDALGPGLRGMRILDAGCGTGALAIELARRGAQVLAVDLSPQLIDLARRRAPDDLGEGSVLWVAGDMLDPTFGHFDHVVGMDSLIHYEAQDMALALARLAVRTRLSLRLTFAPRNPALALMHLAGRMLPRGDRAPSIVPVAVHRLIEGLEGEEGLRGFALHAGPRVRSGFYISQLLSLVRSGER